MALALARSAGFALVRPASRPQLDPARIATLSGTLALNALVLGLLLIPVSVPPAVQVTANTAPDFRWIDPPTPKPPVPVVIERRVRQPTQRVPTPAPMAPAPIAIAPIPAPTAPADAAVFTAEETPAPAIAQGEAGASIAPAPALARPMSLAVRANPAPAYPRRAMQQGLTGTVLLEVLVGTDGTPLQVTVIDSSGHRLLDDAAREQILRRWRFHPANVDGQAVQALGRVPVTFSLER